MAGNFVALKMVRSESKALGSITAGLEDCPKGWIENWLHKVLPAEGVDGFSFFLRRNDFDVIITEDYRTAIVFGFLTRIFGRRSKHVVKELYLAEDALTSRLKRAIFQWTLKHSDCVIVNASSERTAYAEFLEIPLDRVVFLAWPSNLPLSPKTGDDQGYVFAAGRSMRDWKTLFACAASLSVPFVVVASRGDVAPLEVPPNVAVHCDVDREEYLKMLQSAQVVVLPLTRTVRSTGQAVALEAMSLRKPLVCADTPGILDYVDDEENGLLYQTENPASLQEKLERVLASSELRARLANTGAERIRARFNKETYSLSLKALMAKLLEKKTR